MSLIENTLPTGWTRATLGELVDRLQYGYTAKAEADSNGTRFLRITDIKDDGVNWDTVPGCRISEHDLDKYRLENGDIVFARSGSIEKAWRVKNAPDAVFASYLIRGKPIIAGVGEWLEYFVKSRDYLYQIGAASAGIGMQNVNAQKLSRVKLPLAPIKEQRRIVAKLDELFARVDACRKRLEQVPRLLKEFRQAVLAAACSGKLTEGWRKANLIGDSWGKVILSDVATKVTDGEHITPKRSTRGKFLLSARNIQNGLIALDNVDYVEDIEFERIRKRCDPSIGDVLISCSGTVGRVALVDRDSCYVMVRSAAMIRPRKELLHPAYLMYALQSPYLQSQIGKKSSATAQANIFLGAIKSLILPLPELPEQQEIVRRIKALFKIADAVEENYLKAQGQLATLPQSILAKAFRGELVPQDPTDEPGSALLERIRTAKAHGEKPTRKTKLPPRKAGRQPAPRLPFAKSAED